MTLKLHIVNHFDTISLLFNSSLVADSLNFSKLQGGHL